MRYEKSEATIAEAVAEWRQRIDRFELNTAFREDFGDSLLLLVYGLVKAGKSSLGELRGVRAPRSGRVGDRGFARIRTGAELLRSCAC